jgi:DNA-binding response OmpR family regulator
VITMNVLIIDDNQINLTIYSSLLRAMDGITPIEFLDSRKAISWCEHNNPDLILLDYIMPELNGFEFISIFRELKGKETVPVVIITAVTAVEVRHKLLKATANDFLNKPIDKVEFIARVKNMLQLEMHKLN